MKVRDLYNLDALTFTCNKDCGFVYLEDVNKQWMILIKVLFRKENETVYETLENWLNSSFKESTFYLYNLEGEDNSWKS